MGRRNPAGPMTQNERAVHALLREASPVTSKRPRTVVIDGTRIDSQQATALLALIDSMTPSEVRRLLRLDGAVLAVAANKIIEESGAGRLHQMSEHRANPELILLTNPEAVPGESTARAAWGEFHLRPGEHAKVFSVPGAPGVPKTVVVLGALEGVEFPDGKKVMLGKRRTKGPWLVTNTRMDTLWMVAARQSDFSRIAQRGGERVAAVYYFPPSNSGKYDRQRGFRHEFGEGHYPPAERPKAYPTLKILGPRAARLTKPRGAKGYVIEDRGIVG